MLRWSLQMSTETKTRTGGVLAATCLSTLVVNANTSAVTTSPGWGDFPDAV